MDIISYFKNKFSKNIEIKGDVSNHLVYVYYPKKGKIWFGKKIAIPENFTFIFGSNGKAYDSFKLNEVELNAIYLPKLVKKLKLDKQNKKGRLPQYFKADCYFVNGKLFEYEKWRAYRKLEIFDEKYGYFKVLFSGGVAYKIVDSQKFLGSLLKIYDYLYQNEAKELLDGLIVEYILKYLDKKNYDYNKITNKDLLSDEIFEKLAKEFEKMGVEIAGFNIEEIKLPKKLSKQVLKDLRLQEVNELNKSNENTSEEVEYNKDFEYNNEFEYDKNHRIIYNHQLLQDDKAKIEMVITKVDSDGNVIETLEPRNNKATCNRCEDIKCRYPYSKHKNFKKERRLVKKAIKELSKNKKNEERIICKYCGIENSIEDTNCMLCMQELKGEI